MTMASTETILHRVANKPPPSSSHLGRVIAGVVIGARWCLLNGHQMLLTALNNGSSKNHSPVHFTRGDTDVLLTAWKTGKM